MPSRLKLSKIHLYSIFDICFCSSIQGHHTNEYRNETVAIDTTEKKNQALFQCHCLQAATLRCVLNKIKCPKTAYKIWCVFITQFKRYKAVCIIFFHPVYQRDDADYQQSLACSCRQQLSSQGVKNYNQQITYRCTQFLYHYCAKRLLLLGRVKLHKHGTYLQLLLEPWVMGSQSLHGQDSSYLYFSIGIVYSNSIGILKYTTGIAVNVSKMSNLRAMP